ncbi:zinc finger, C2H2 type, partial [Teladorsagia circumcincta]
VKCGYCAENRAHPKLARGESYSCGYKPYRCELCKYSTTTKGNLSIHMQSDKHLHAVQELPSSIASLSCPPARSPPSDGDHSLVCVVCGCFSSDDLEEMIAHADK